MYLDELRSQVRFSGHEVFGGLVTSDKEWLLPERSAGVPTASCYQLWGYRWSGPGGTLTDTHGDHPWCTRPGGRTTPQLRPSGAAPEGSERRGPAQQSGAVLVLLGVMAVGVDLLGLGVSADLN